MCDGRTRLPFGGAAIAAAALGLATAGSGQSAPELRARLARLEPALRQAIAATGRADSLRRQGSRGAADTLRVGHLTVLAWPPLSNLAAAAARAVWPRLDSLYGDAARSLAAERFWVLPAAEASRFRPGDERVVWVPAEAGVEQVARSLAYQAATHFIVPAWLDGPVVVELQPERERASVYVGLVTAPSRAARGCFLGDLADCRDALELSGRIDYLLRWYDAAERRQIARQFSWLRNAGRNPTYRECVEEGSDSACVQFLQSQDVRVVPRPLTTEARLSFIRLALRRGGRDAFTRLQRPADRPLAARLSAAARLPLDSLIADWRTAVLAGRPHTVTFVPRAAWVALTWGVLFTVLGLRSSRWR